MCNYWHGGTIECRGDGYLWDADCDGYDPEDTSNPCPACNTRGWLLEAREVGESCSFMSGNGYDLTGEQVWLNAVKIAMGVNPTGAPRILRKIGIARPIIDHPTDRAGFIEKLHDYRNTRYVISRAKREGRFLARITR